LLSAYSGSPLLAFAFLRVASLTVALLALTSAEYRRNIVVVALAIIAEENLLVAAFRLALSI
jgi:hypothetical protein